MGAQVEWTNRLVRHILFSEPLVRDFERCFEGLRDEATILALADSFKFENCLPRIALAEVLREGASAKAGR